MALPKKNWEKLAHHGFTMFFLFDHKWHFMVLPKPSNLQADDSNCGWVNHHMEVSYVMGVPLVIIHFTKGFSMK